MRQIAGLASVRREHGVRAVAATGRNRRRAQGHFVDAEPVNGTVRLIDGIFLSEILA
jgi:hypothetical protein